MLFLIFPFISLSFNEAYFENIEDECICAVNPNECNQYCDCDPFCTDDQKDQFLFHLSESLGQNKMSCDPNSKIDKVNTDSIKKYLINGITCYSVEGREYGKKIDNYSPVDFSLENFDMVTELPFVQDKFKVDVNVSYKNGEKVIGAHSTDESHNFYLPISIGSICSNALIPIRFNISYPNYTCRFTPPDNINSANSYFPQSLLIQAITNRNNSKNDQVNFNGYVDILMDLTLRRTFLNLQYIFWVDSNSSSILNVSMKIIPSTESFQASSRFIGFSSLVFFGEDTNNIDNTYTPFMMGYYYGTPLMADNREEDIDKTFFDVSYRTAIKVDSNDILFGANTTIVKLFDDIDYGKVNDTYSVDGIENEFENYNAALIKKVLYNLFPQHKYIFKSYGSIIAGRETNVIIENLLTFNGSNTYISSDHQFPIAYWTFYYKRFNKEDAPVFLLQKFIPSLVIPKNLDIIKNKGMIRIIFIELDEDGNIFSDEEARFHSGQYSTLFDFFFMDKRDALNTIGIFFCFAIMASIWCWYACFFYIED